MIINLQSFVDECKLPSQTIMTKILTMVINLLKIQLALMWIYYTLFVTVPFSNSYIISCFHSGIVLYRPKVLQNRFEDAEVRCTETIQAKIKSFLQSAA